jgi:hypothetical protein
VQESTVETEVHEGEESKRVEATDNVEDSQKKVITTSTQLKMKI